MDYKYSLKFIKESGLEGVLGSVEVNEVSAVPDASGDELPVGEGEEVFFKVVEGTSGFFLVFEEGFVDDAVVSEFSEDELFVSDKDGAGGVSLVFIR